MTLVNIFPTELDFKRINLAIKGYSNVESILEKFHEKCFFVGEVNDKYATIQKVCDNANSVFNIDDEFLSHLLSRESIGSTYFGNGVAIPHPFIPMSDETFISVGVLSSPIDWDKQHQVQLVMLVSIEKNNPKAFQLWNYLSDIVKNKDAINQLTRQKYFDGFVKQIRKVLV